MGSGFIFDPGARSLATSSPALAVRVGAPCYRMNVRAEHACMLGELGRVCDVPMASLGIPGVKSERQLAIEAWAYAHTTLLAPGRARILTDAVDSKADLLVSIDADTWIEVPHLVRALAIASELGDAWGVLGVLVPQDDRRVNAWSAMGQRVERPPAWRPTPVWAVGSAISIHNLAWHRRVRERLASEDTARAVRWPWITYACVPGEVPGAYVGEDVFHCQLIAQAGGSVLGLYTGGGVYHAAFPG